jgi:hypothetical protein
MATHDYVIANASGAAVRSDLNNALAAIVSNNSNATEPATTYAFMWWYDTTNGQLKQRNAANNDWNLVPTWDTNGNIGIGTTTPTRDFDLVRTAADANLRIETTSTGNDARLELIGDNTGASQIRFGDQNSVNPGAITYDHSTNDLSFNTNSNTVVTISSGGDVGIGTVSPTENLEVQSASNTTIRIENEDDSTAKLLFHNTGSANMDISVSSGSMIFNQGGTETVKIDADGILTTRKAIGSTYYSATSTDLRVFTNTGGNTGAVALESTTNTNALRVHFTFSNNNGVVGSIRTSSSATIYSTSSDYRLKENVTLITDGIARLQQLKPSRFNFIADPDEVVDGFIAHEVEDIVPEAISGEKDAVNENGDPEYQAIDQSKLVPLLTAALQEAVARIETLETRITALEAAN